MPNSHTPADLAAAVVASIAVVRTAAEPAREHARWLQSGRVVAFDTAELESRLAPTAPAALGDTPSDISDAIVRVLFGSVQQGANDRGRSAKQASLSVTELQWEQVGHLFAGAVMQDTVDQAATHLLAVPDSDRPSDDGAVERGTSSDESSGN
jgi:hypothetical protein